MSNKWLLAALGSYSQSLALSVKRELHFPSSFSMNLGIKMHYTDLGALPTMPKSATGFWSWDVLIG